MMVERSFGMKKKKRNAAAQVPREYLSAGLIGCILFIVAVTLIVCFSPVGEKLSGISVGWSSRSAQLVHRSLLSSPVTTFSRVHSLSCHFLSISVSLFLFLCLYLHLFLTAVISSLLCIRRYFKRANEQHQSEFLRESIAFAEPLAFPRLFCRLVILLSSSAALLRLFTLASIIPAAK